MSHGISPALKQAICTFKPVEKNSHLMFCQEPLPRGPCVIVTKYWDQLTTRFVPATGVYYVVAITDTTRTGNAECGQIMFSMSHLREELLKALRAMTWLKDPTADWHLVGRMLKTPFGDFMPIYDTGWRSLRPNESTSIRFIPDPEGPYVEVLKLARNQLFCSDQTEVIRATNALQALQAERITQNN